MDTLTEKLLAIVTGGKTYEIQGETGTHSWGAVEMLHQMCFSLHT